MKRAVLMAAGMAVAMAAAAENFPSKPMRMVLPNPPGGTVDVVARAVALGIAPALGQPVVIEAKPGGNNVIGCEVVARSAPDGYTMLMGGTHITINPLVRKLPYDGMNAFEPVALLASTPNVIAVNTAFPARTLAELLAFARSSKVPLNLATATPGNGIHLTAEHFQSAAGVAFNFIPYQGGIQAALAVAGGHADVAVVPLSDAAPQVRSGRLRLLAVTSAERSNLVQDVPTLAESGFPGFQAVQWFGTFVPAGTPKPVIERLSAAMLRAVDTPEVRGIFAPLGLNVTPLGTEAFRAFLRSETQTFAAVIRDNHIKIE
jgi:tripartite-type tricarboxylate transporter receptor subunit TctC